MNSERPDTMPTSVSPMLATLTEDRFSDTGWIFERKWDGIRCIAYRSADGVVRLRTRNDLPLERTYPEVAEALVANAGTSLVLDGEVVRDVFRET
jgi:ATP-dependent DNA ligase